MSWLKKINDIIFIKMAGERGFELIFDRVKQL